jgi:hypothetical protein
MAGSSGLSRFEEIIATNEPILNGILSHLPTHSIFSLYSASPFLRHFLKSYPLAWKTISFRLQQPVATIGSPGADQDSRNSRCYSLDLALRIVILPVATRLTNLDLCNTAIHGVTLIGDVLSKRADTLQHLSVRGCKNVSLKYHIVPFLRCYKQEQEMSQGAARLALKSLYTYRCRHHRRRPYLPASLFRRDSDSEPTHELIELCHYLGIWTDTAWCPTPGPRCCRRKDYHSNRSAPGSTEVWVPFDRLWRSSNRIGPTTNETSQNLTPVGKLWEEIEYGLDGEPLGMKGADFTGEGRHTPAHMRKSHRQFVDDIKCDDCGNQVSERCETCSIKMHCMGCRKTLCSSCAFNKPYHRQKAQSAWALASDPSSEKSPSKFWWAPGARRSPNLMIDAPEEDDSDDDTPMPVTQNNERIPLKLTLKWCCLEPLFSGGGGVAFVGPGLGGPGQDRIRAVPLPKQQEFLDPDFVSILSTSLADSYKETFERFENSSPANIDILPYLKQTSLNLQATTCPRSLCHTCYDSLHWKISCHACKRAVCKEHDFRALKVRKCGFRELTEERDYVRNPPKHVEGLLVEPESKPPQVWPRDLQIPAFRRPDSPDSGPSEDERRARTTGAEDSLEESDAGSSAFEGPGTRDPSSTPRVTPGPSFDRSSSAFRSSPSRELFEVKSPLATPTTLGPSSSSAASPGSSRGRSSSMSDVPRPPTKVPKLPSHHSPGNAGYVGKGKAKAATAHQQQREKWLLPCSPSHPVQFKGCGEYFCQAQRAMGDARPRCTAGGKDCVECAVYVCEVRFYFQLSL